VAAPPAGAAGRHDGRLRQLLGRGGDDAGAAGGAGGTRAEPGVDAGHVEGVVAAREHAQRVALGELGEADGAVRGGGGGGGEGHGGQRVDGLLLETFGWRSLLLLRGRRGGGRPAAAEAAGAAGDEGEAEHADERAQEGRQDDHHVGVHRHRRLLLLLLGRRRRRRLLLARCRGGGGGCCLEAEARRGTRHGALLCSALLSKRNRGVGV